VIDFYTGDENSPLPSPPLAPAADGSLATAPRQKAHIAMHLDVRPAIDTPAALLWRMKFSAMKFFERFAARLPFSLPFPKFGSLKDSRPGDRGSDKEAGH
jgi:hypothetical protein